MLRKIDLMIRRYQDEVFVAAMLGLGALLAFGFLALAYEVCALFTA